MLSSDDHLAQVAGQIRHPLFYDLLELEPGFVPTVADLERHG